MFSIELTCDITLGSSYVIEDSNFIIYQNICRRYFNIIKKKKKALVVLYFICVSLYIVERCELFAQREAHSLPNFLLPCSLVDKHRVRMLSIWKPNSVSYRRLAVIKIIHLFMWPRRSFLPVDLYLNLNAISPKYSILSKICPDHYTRMSAFLRPWPQSWNH